MERFKTRLLFGAATAALAVSATFGLAGLAPAEADIGILDCSGPAGQAARRRTGSLPWPLRWR